MLMDYSEYQKFYEWVGKHPILGTLTIIGGIAILIALIYISQRLDDWELRKKYGKGRWK